jgi:hypothetical protein
MRSRLSVMLLLMVMSPGCDPREDRSSPTTVASTAVTSSAALAVVPAPTREWPKDAPSPTQACKAHDDCAITTWDGPCPPDPCCDCRLGFTPVNRKYLTWMHEYRKQHCQGAVCRGAPLPGAEPGCCAVIPRCVAGNCRSACEDPSIVVPKVSHLDPECLRPAGM